MLRRTFAVLLPAALLVACSSPASSGQESQGGGAQSAGTSAAPAMSAAASAGGGGGGGGNSLAFFDVTITGGEYAGHYLGQILEGGCSTGVTGPGTFAVASPTVIPASAFDGPQITIYDTDAAASGTDSQFSAAFLFNGAYRVEVNPYLSASQGGNFGSGIATLDNRGDTATVTVDGTTAAGETVKASIECYSVTNY